MFAFPALAVASGALAQGRAASQAASYNAQVLENNALTEQLSASARASGAARGSNQRIASTRAAASASGFEQSGSISDLIGQAQLQGELEYLTAVYDGTLRSQSLRSAAAGQRAEGANARRSSRIGAATSLFSGVSSAFSMSGGVGGFGGRASPSVSSAASGGYSVGGGIRITK